MQKRTPTWRFTLPLLALLACLPAFAAEPVVHEDPYVTVSKQDDALRAALGAGRADQLEDLLGPGFVEQGSDGSVREREEVLEALRSRAVHFDEYRQEQRTVRILGPETATVSSRVHRKGRSGDKAFEDEIWVTDVYVRLYEGWRVLLSQVAPATKASN